MYTVYQYAAGATQANVLADLVALITGETNKASLSADCVQAGTTIVSVEAAGWAVYDAAAGTNIQCLRSLNQDGSTYKYWLLQFGTTTAFSHAIAEAWDAGAHTGTNVSAYSASTWSSANGGFIYIYATPKNIVIQAMNSGTYIQPVLMCEMSRDTIPSTYPCHARLTTLSSIGGSTGAASMPRVKNPGATGDFLNVTTINCGPVMVYAASTSLNNTQLFRTAAEVVQMAVYRMGWTLSNSCMLGSGYDLYLTGSTAGFLDGDEISYGGRTYVASRIGGAGTILIPKE